MLDHLIGLFYVSAMVREVQLDKEWIISSIFGPSGSGSRESFWRELAYIRNKWSGPWCLRGNFNIIRYFEARMGGCNVSVEMKASLIGLILTL